MADHNVNTSQSHFRNSRIWCQNFQNWHQIRELRKWDWDELPELRKCFRNSRIWCQFWQFWHQIRELRKWDWDVFTGAGTSTRDFAKKHETLLKTKLICPSHKLKGKTHPRYPPSPSLPITTPMMIRPTFTLLLLTLFLTASARAPVCQRAPRLEKRNKRQVPAHCFGDHVVVANRNGRSITFINPKTLAVVAQVKLGRGSEPMYFAVNPEKSEVWVGDRGKNRLQVYRLSGSKIRRNGTIPTPKGLFHSMLTQDQNVRYPIVWTTCDIANVTVVHDVTTRRKLAEIPLPRVVKRLGGVPHDVTSNAKYGFVSYLGNSNGAGYVAAYDSTTFKLVKMIKTPDDPHVAIRDETKLAIAAQGGAVLLVSIPDLKVIARDGTQPSPHGTKVSFDSKYLYITNIAEMGKNAIVTYDIATLKRLPCPEVTTTNPVPHNPMATRDGSRIFITHSGATAKVVSVFDIDDTGCPIPDSEKIVKTGLNPFGLRVLTPAADVDICRA